jgi:hypothetical protein
MNTQINADWLEEQEDKIQNELVYIQVYMNICILILMDTYAYMHLCSYLNMNMNIQIDRPNWRNIRIR